VCVCARETEGKPGGGGGEREGEKVMSGSGLATARRAAPPAHTTPLSCEDRVRDGPASGEKGSKGRNYVGARSVSVFKVNPSIWLATYVSMYSST